VTTAFKGNATEAAVLQALTECDFAVLIPFGEGHPYDLAVEIAPNRFLRVQCKTARVENDCVVFNSRSTDHGRGQGTYLGRADIFGVSCRSTGKIYLVPVHEVPTSVVYLRLTPTRNNQRLKVRYAVDYEFERWTAERLAAVLRGERPGALSLVA
jgi:hypothetical protein